MKTIDKNRLSQVVLDCIYDRDRSYLDVATECASTILGLLEDGEVVSEVTHLKLPRPEGDRVDSVDVVTSLILEHPDTLNAVVHSMLNTVIPGFNVRHGQRVDKPYTGRTVHGRWVPGRLVITLFNVPSGFPPVSTVAELLAPLTDINISLQYSESAFDSHAR